MRYAITASGVDTLKAIEFQKQALQLLPQDSLQRSQYEDRLAEFEAALNNKTLSKETVPWQFHVFGALESLSKP